MARRGWVGRSLVSFRSRKSRIRGIHFVGLVFQGEVPGVEDLNSASGRSRL